MGISTALAMAGLHVHFQANITVAPIRHLVAEHFVVMAVGTI